MPLCARQWKRDPSPHDPPTPYGRDLSENVRSVLGMSGTRLFRSAVRWRAQPYCYSGPSRYRQAGNLVTVRIAANGWMRRRDMIEMNLLLLGRAVVRYPFPRLIHQGSRTTKVTVYRARQYQRRQPLITQSGKSLSPGYSM